jgi:hypothetical protein
MRQEMDHRIATVPVMPVLMTIAVTACNIST